MSLLKSCLPEVNKLVSREGFSAGLLTLTLTYWGIWLVFKCIRGQNVFNEHDLLGYELA